MKKNELVKHFEKLGLARSTVYQTYNRIQNVENLKSYQNNIKDKKRSGRPGYLTPQKKKQLILRVNNRKGQSQRRLGKRFHQSTIGHQIKNSIFSVESVRKHLNMLKDRIYGLRFVALNFRTYFIGNQYQS